jgi:glycosyltransferase involved in cell wall biosynthesis
MDKRMLRELDRAASPCLAGLSGRLPFESVVMISPYLWNFGNEMSQTTHHVARQLSRLCSTVFVEPPVQWNPWSEQFRWRRLPRAMGGDRVRSPEGQLLVLHRRGLPLGRAKPLRAFDLRRNARSLRRLLDEKGLRGILLWHSFPYWSGPLVDAVGAPLRVYHCLDGTSRDEEASLVRGADVTFCVSETLVRKLRPLNPRTHLLANGVDTDVFAPERVKGRPRPRDLPSEGPIIGFVGSLNCHLDLELLVRVARAFPRQTLVVVGPVLANETAPQGRQREALRELKAFGNVRLIGFKRERDVPLYLSHFDVCLIPFLDDGFNQERDPLKFYQYMAMGRPVVTTPVPAALRYADVCRVGRTPSEFVDHVADALGPPRADEIEARLEVGRKHSWEAVVGHACAILADLAERESRVARLPIGGDE